LPYITYDGVADYTKVTTVDNNRLWVIKTKIYVTGEDDQNWFSPQSSNFFNTRINAVSGAGSPAAVQLNFFFGGTRYTDLERLEVGWHILEARMNPLPVGIYDIYIDGVAVTTLTDGGGGSGGYFLNGHALGLMFTSPTFYYVQHNIEYHYFETERGNGYVIKGGRVVTEESIDSQATWTNTNDSDAARSTLLSTKVDPLGETPVAGGYVHNQADCSLIQQDSDIVDFIVVDWVSFPADPDYTGTYRVFAKTGDTKFEYTAPGPIPYKIEYQAGWGEWRFYQGAVEFSDNPADTPLPPQDFGSIQVYCGYEGSLWVDTLGNYKELTWAALNGHQSAALNVIKQYEKSNTGVCCITELIQLTQELQLTEGQIAGIVGGLDNTGCQLKPTPYLLTDGTPYKTAHDSFYIIGE